ncbi:Imm7 family immunity protein [Paenibacillus faecalis]|uniref:Imm7 family immunity protein n=1 Tax=Paenibacillus faecalis TaxID=2079532 RepID=UPI000D0E87FB|nr:Imm7 family immunity protein [Paenibacillus faecalis]
MFKVSVVESKEDQLTPRLLNQERMNKRMYEYHGWATFIESSFYEENEDKYLLVVNEIQKHFNQLNWSSGVSRKNNRAQ